MLSSYSQASTLTLLLPLIIPFLPVDAAAATLSSLTEDWNLDEASWTFVMPNEAMGSDDAQVWIRKSWDLTGRISWGGNDIVFSPDPSTPTSTLVRRQSAETSSATSSVIGSATTPASTGLSGQPPVLRIAYPQGSYSKSTGGTQFYATPLNATSDSGDVVGNSTTNGQYERMLLSYDIWFPSGYAWNMGGKLPGLRGGADTHGCSGGDETDGVGCFSTRLMWRSGGLGEVYAYFPTNVKGFCSQNQVTCNSDYGTSLARGSFSFTTGQWQTIWLLVVLNEVGTANGVVQLYYNGVQAMSFTNLELRSSADLASIGGMFFSTFFGGDDATWATPTNQYTYYRNLALHAGVGAANGTGVAIGVASTMVSSWGVGGLTAIAGISIGVIVSALSL